LHMSSSYVHVAECPFWLRGLQPLQEGRSGAPSPNGLEHDQRSWSGLPLVLFWPTRRHNAVG